MKYSLNIDAGGTMTDGVLSGGGETFVLKVESTPHDLTVSLVQVIERAAELTGAASPREFLRDVAFIRWSSTVTSNALAERKGPPLGLIVSPGHGSDLYGPATSPAIGSLIPPEQVITLDTASPDAAMVVETVRALLENGVRRICISLAGAYWDRQGERELKRLIDGQYPDHYLGCVPVLTGTDILEWPDDMTRTHYALVNAYTHPSLATSLFKAEDRLRDEFNWRRPFLVGHTNGGVARIGKTKAIDTIESGPIFGTYGAAFLGARSADDTLLCMDVGGTTAKASAVRAGQPVRQTAGDLFGIGIRMPMQLLRSAAVGGGSYISLGDAADGIAVGPGSAGAAPGPACYGLGGTAPTLTDALLTLGYINADNFLDGRRTLDVAAATTALQREIAEPLSLSVAAAALAARDRAAAVIAELIDTTAVDAGIAMSDSVMAVYGGNGPLLGPFVAEQLGIPRLYVPLRFGPVFGAFGAATCDVKHVYQRSLHDLLGGDCARLEDGLAILLATARRELRSEGFDHNDASFHFQIQAGDNDPNAPPQSWPAGDDLDIDALSAALRTGAGSAQRDPRILELHVSLPLASLTIDGDARPQQAASTRTDRDARFTFCVGSDGQAEQVTGTIHDPAALVSGQSLNGPALISGGSTSCIIPPRWRGQIDDFGNCELRRE